MKMSRFCFAVALMGLCLTAAGQASAGTIAFDAWAGNAQKVGDKTFTFISDGGANQLTGKNLDAKFSHFDVGVIGDFCDDIYDFSLEGAGINSLGNGSFNLRYTVEIDSAMAPNCWFATAALDSTHVNDDISLTKRVFSDAFITSAMTDLSSINGGPQGPNGISGQLLKIWVEDIIVISAGGIVDDINNTFTQTSVPEPSSLALLGLGGLGLVLRLRRRSK